MQHKRVLRSFFISVLVCVVLGVAGMGAVFWSIYQSVHKYTVLAQEAHPSPGDDVAALVAYMNSDEHDLQQRNFAVWALGRLRDPHALAPLQAMYTGELCDHSKCLCQYELAKAITLCGGIPDPPRKTRH
jgi:hypothetical protein